MLEFILMTISFTVAILLALTLACVIMLQPAVLKWYTKKMLKVTQEISEEVIDAL